MDNRADGQERGGDMAERWATYEDAGRQFGLSADAMRKRARRLGWRVQAGNDGRARVLVPEGAGLGPDGRSGRAPARPDDRADGLTAELRHRAEAAESRVAALTAEVAAERERRQVAEAAAALAEGKAAGLREGLRMAETSLMEAIKLADNALRRADAAAGEAGRREAEALAQLTQATGRAERVPALEAEVAGLREALARADANAADVRRREAQAVVQLQQAEGRAEVVPALEAEVAVLRAGEAQQAVEWAVARGGAQQVAEAALAAKPAGVLARLVQRLRGRG